MVSRAYEKVYVWQVHAVAQRGMKNIPALQGRVTERQTGFSQRLQSEPLFITPLDRDFYTMD